MLGKKVIVNISGGLGNQLFQLAAAVHLQNEGYKISVDSLYNDLDGFRSTEIKEITEDLNIHYIKRNPIFLRVLKNRFFRKIYLLGIRKKTIFEVENFGVPSICRKRKHYRISGYWQTITVASQIQKRLTQSCAGLRKDEIALHVRRGDYLSAQHQLHGALSGDYYLRAVANLKKKRGSQKIVIYTDSPEIVKNEVWLSSLKGEDVTFSDSLKPWETLLEMSKSSAIICSNSTFSWWAAFIGEDKDVVMPSKWFKESVLPESLRLPGSSIIEATFI
jgi:hypothetical protein